LVKDGIAGPPSEYFPSYKENQLTGEEIRKLLFGSKITGINLYNGLQWWVERKKDGEFTWSGGGPIPFDTGRNRVEGNMICTQYQKIHWGLEYRSTVFKNPRGTYEGKDEYVFCADWGFSPWSIAR
jgi:hypothetical protein